MQREKSKWNVGLCVEKSRRRWMMKRGLKADLELCNKATPGPFIRRVKAYDLY